MNDRQLVAAARMREQRAREREARALAQQVEAARRAREAPDPDSAATHLLEAELHRRAASLHHQAIEVQVRHALEHESSPDGGARDTAATAPLDPKSRAADGQVLSFVPRR